MKNEQEVRALIKDLEDEIAKDIYTHRNMTKHEKTCANLGRIGGLQLAIIKIKTTFGIAPYKKQTPQQ